MRSKGHDSPFSSCRDCFGLGVGGVDRSGGWVEEGGTRRDGRKDGTREDGVLAPCTYDQDDGLEGGAGDNGERGLEEDGGT